LLTLCRAFNRAGIEPVLLKGAPLLLAREPAGYRRMMLDLDIWVPDGHQLDQAVRSLHDLGYRMHEDPATSSHTQHYPPFFHDGEIARVELHWDIVNTRLSELMDQKACAAAAVPRESDGIRYRVLDERTALALSYLQCRLGVGAQKGYVTMMKWLDFLDRAHRLNIVAPRTRAELGLRGEWEQSDRQFLTALSDWADYPHGGERDDRFVRCWERSYREPFLIGYLKAMIGPAFRSERWKGKTAADLIRSVRYRLRTLPLLHERARSRDHFGS
jgi:hypothetical protein